MTTAAAAIAIVTASAAAKSNFPAPPSFLVAAILIASTTLKAEQSDGRTDGAGVITRPPIRDLIRTLIVIMFHV